MNYVDKIKALPIWKGNISLNPLEGGITNHNYLIKDGTSKYVVRMGEDIPEHLVYRSNELNVSKAAHAIGVSPKLIHFEPGVMVFDYIQCKTLDPETVRIKLDKIMPIIKKIHFEMPNQLNGQSIIFWVFYVIKYYSNFLKKNNSSYVSIIQELIKKSETLEKLSSPRDIVFGHNDFLAANFLDDGSKIWVVDWEYGGFNDPLFDIGGLASNNDFDTELENHCLELYYDQKPSKELLIRYNAMKAASLLRETMWSMVSEITSNLEFDYSKYTEENLTKFNNTFESL